MVREEGRWPILAAVSAVFTWATHLKIVLLTVVTILQVEVVETVEADGALRIGGLQVIRTVDVVRVVSRIVFLPTG